MLYIFVIMIVLVIWLAIKLLRSSKFDKFCNDLSKGKLDTESTTKDTMNDITTAKKDLGKQVEVNTKAAEMLTNESEGINNFLGKAGVSNTEKGEDK